MKRNYQEEFISLMLKDKKIIEDYLLSPIDEKYFDKKYKFIIHCIQEEFNNDVLLTKKTFTNYVSKLISSKKDIMAQEIIYSSIKMLNISHDDFPNIKTKILEDYMLKSAIEVIDKFNKDKDQSMRNALINMSASVNDIVDGTSINEGNIIYEDVRNHSKEWLTYIEDVRDGKIEEEDSIECGIKEIDEIVVSFAPGTLTLFTGDVGGFKSSSMLNVGSNVAKNGKNVLYIPLEMSRDQMFTRLIAKEAKVDSKRIMKPKCLTEDEMKKIKEAVDIINNYNGRLFWLDYSLERVTVSQIRREIEKHIDMFEPDMIVVDYIANLLPDNHLGGRNDLEIGEMLKSLRHMGKHFGFAVVSGAQIGREALKRNRRSDQITAYSEDIRGSHEYSADADTIFMQWQDENNKEILWLVPIKGRHGGKTFKDGSNKAQLEVIPEYGIIQSKKDLLLEENESFAVLSKVDEEANKIDLDAIEVEDTNFDELFD